MSISRAERFPNPSALPPDEEQTARHVQLKSEDIERSVERLAKARVWKPDRTPILPPIVKNEDEIGKTIERLYYAKMKQTQEKQQKMQQMAATHQASSKKLSVDTQEEMANRLSSNPKTKQVEKLREKYYNQTYAAPQAKVLPSQQLQDNIGRMYNESLMRKKETEKRLRQKYVENTLPAPRRLPADAIAAASERLYTTAGK